MPRKISRRDLLSAAGAAALTLAGTRSSSRALAGALPQPTKAAVGQRYNVLFLPIDDLNPHLGCYGNKVVQTPNIDRLAARGVRFTQVYAQVASCLPSRASFMSGWYPERTGVLDFSPKARDGRMKDVVYLGQHFRDNGYFAARLDKVFHIGADDALSWDVSEEPIREKKPMWTGMEVEALGLQARVLKEGRYDKVKGEKGPYAVLDAKDEELFDGMKTTRAIELLEQSAKDKKPFFLACGYRRPHLPWIAPKKYFDLYPPEKIVLPPPNPNDTERVPEADHREMIAHYYACITYMDAQVGRLLDALDQLKLRDSTIVVLFGDNGYCLGERGMHFGKGNLWERSLWVPLIVSMPGAARGGQACQRSVGLIDLYPTLVEACGLPQPKSGLQGHSLVPLLGGESAAWKDQTVSVYPLKGGIGRSVRTDRYRYTEDGSGAPLEFIDHQADPYEWKNLAADPQHADLRARLRAVLHEGRV